MGTDPFAGEIFGDLENVFFSKNGKTIAPTKQNTQTSNVPDFSKMVSKFEQEANSQTTQSGKTVIMIEKELVGLEEDFKVELTDLEEKRFNTFIVRNKEFINLNDGSLITIVEKTKLYNGQNLYTVKDDIGQMITYPRSKFIGRTKQFVPKDFYIREAERLIEDTIDNHYRYIEQLLHDPVYCTETSDGKYLEVLMPTPIEIINNIFVPDKIQIPVKRLFDLEYKLMSLESVICMDNKIAALIFLDLWF